MGNEQGKSEIQRKPSSRGFWSPVDSSKSSKNSVVDEDFDFTEFQTMCNIKVGRGEIRVLEPSVIIPGFLYLSGYNFVKDHPEKLAELGITYVVNASVETPNVEETKASYHRCEMVDVPTESLLDKIDPALKVMHRAKRKHTSVLVHCAQGRSRSVAIVVAYLIKYRQFTCVEALLHVKKCRDIAFPNVGFATQLGEYELSVLGAKTLTIREYYVLELLQYGKIEREVAEKAIDFFGEKSISNLEVNILKDNPNISKEEALAKAEFEKAEIEKNSMNGLGVSTKTNG